MPTTTTPQVRFRTIDGVRIRYADSGSPQKPAVVLTSPWPESVYAFAPIWASLAEHARLFAVDLPGFGASERREDLLSPRAMGEFLAQLVAEADLGTPHIVALDVGTAGAGFLGDPGPVWARRTIRPRRADVGAARQDEEDGLVSTFPRWPSRSPRRCGAQARW